MSDELLYQYLSAQGFKDEYIVTILAESMERKSIESLILNYERELAEAGYSRSDALENFLSYQKIKKLAELKKNARL